MPGTNENDLYKQLMWEATHQPDDPETAILKIMAEAEAKKKAISARKQALEEAGVPVPERPGCADCKCLIPNNGYGICTACPVPAVVLDHGVMTKDYKSCMMLFYEPGGRYFEY